MKKYSFVKYLEEKRAEESNRQKKIGAGIILLIFILIITLIGLYIGNQKFRDFIDIHILRKQITESEAAKLTIDSSDVSLVYPFDENIVILDNGELDFYDSNAKLVGKQNITLSKPIAASEGKYLVLGDEGLHKLYLIKNNTIEWQKDLEGEIIKVNVNQNGYVSVIVSDSTHESIIVLYDNSGNELFKKFLATTTAISSAVSENNKYLSIAEMDYSGINISSKVEMISIEDALNNKENSIVNTYKADIGKLILDISYKKDNTLYCRLEDSIISITPKKSQKIYEKNNNTIFMTSSTKNSFARIEKKASGIIKSDYRMEIRDMNGNDKVYIIENSIKDMKNSNKIVALNYGKQINFINLNGWLKKKYISEKEIKDVILSDKVAAIIYKDKIDIIKI